MKSKSLKCFPTQILKDQGTWSDLKTLFINNQQLFRYGPCYFQKKGESMLCFVCFFTNSNTHSISNETQENAKLLPGEKIKLSEVKFQIKVI